MEENVAELSEEQMEEALLKYEKMKECLEGNVTQSELARACQVSRKTVQRWIKRYREAGISGLVKQRRGDNGKRRGVGEELKQLVEGLYLRSPKPSIRSVYRRACVVAEEQGWRSPSYDQVYEIVKDLPPALVTLAHEGGKGYREKYDLLYRWEAKGPNEVWQADHSQLPIFVLNERGRACKPRLTIVLDDYSRCIAGYRLSWAAPSAIQTCLSLRGAIFRKGEENWPVCGIPERLYTDHGSDFTSRALEAVAADLKMELIFSQKGRPRGRGKIERFFRTVAQELLCDLPGYAPKVDWRHQRESDEQCKPAARLTMVEIEALFQKWLLETYHVSCQEGIGEAPLARYRAAPFVPRMPGSFSELDVLLLKFPAKRRVQQDGISFQGQKYFDLALAEYVGEEVIVRYDPGDLSEIAVYVADGGRDDEYLRERLICRAKSVSEAEVRLEEVVAVRSARRKALRKELGVRAQKVEEYTSEEKESGRWKEIAQRALDASKKKPEESRRVEESVEEEPRIKRFEHE